VLWPVDVFGFSDFQQRYFAYSQLSFSVLTTQPSCSEPDTELSHECATTTAPWRPVEKRSARGKAEPSWRANLSSTMRLVSLATTPKTSLLRMFGLRLTHQQFFIFFKNIKKSGLHSKTARPPPLFFEGVRACFLIKK
jgi:hypothetical protein